MPPKRRSKTTTENAKLGKQTNPATMSAIGDKAIVALTVGAKDSKDLNRLLPLNIIANQKSADEKD